MVVIALHASAKYVLLGVAAVIYSCMCLTVNQSDHPLEMILNAAAVVWCTCVEKRNDTVLYIGTDL